MSQPGEAALATLRAENERLRARLAELEPVAARESQMRHVADALPVLISYVDREHCYRFNNRAYERWFGINRRDMLGKHLSEVMGPEAYAEVRPLIERVLAGERLSVERELTYRGAGARTVLIEYMPDRREDGTIPGYFALVQDISERAGIEQQLRASEARFRQVFQNAGAGMIEIDAAWNILAANAAYSRITGRPEAELRDASVLSFTHPEDVNATEKALRSLAAGKIDQVSFEKRYLRPDGAIIWVRSNLSRISGESGAVRFLKVVEDVTDVHQAREALREESARLETLNRVGASLAPELDLKKVVQMVTDAGVELSGAQFGAFFYNVVNEAGESYMLYTVSGVDPALFARMPMPRNTALFAPTFAGEGVVRSDDITKDPRYGRSDTHHGMPKEHLPVTSYLAVPVISRSGEVIGGLFFGHAEPGRFTQRHEDLLVGIAGQAAVAIDNARLYEAAKREIGERRLAEAALKELNQSLEARISAAIEERERAEEALRQAQKMEAVGQLTGGIAHDFNNLLTIITGNIDAARRHIGAEGAARVRRALGNALVGAERAATLTQRLLAFSRRQPLSPRPVDANKLVAGMSDLLHSTLGETIAVETVLAAGLWRTEADPHQLENAIINLAVNARDAMADGGKLTIETANTHFDTDYAAQNPGVSAGQYVAICISDTGEGMEQETLERAFEPFFTTKEVGKGTGLGLSMVYGFVKQSGGHVKIYSEAGQGTTVRVYLPRLAGADATVAADAESKAPEGSRDETILVCEDDDDVRAYTVEVLCELGYRVLEAQDGPSALRLLEREGKVDLLFTDVVLPAGMTGAVLAAEARALRPDLKVLFTTGYARNAIVHQGRLDPGVELITKPFSYADLAARVRDMLDRD